MLNIVQREIFTRHLKDFVIPGSNCEKSIAHSENAALRWVLQHFINGDGVININPVSLLLCYVVVAGVNFCHSREVALQGISTLGSERFIGKPIDSISAGLDVIIKHRLP